MPGILLNYLYLAIERDNDQYVRYRSSVISIGIQMQLQCFKVQDALGLLESLTWRTYFNIIHIMDDTYCIYKRKF